MTEYFWKLSERIKCKNIIHAWSSHVGLGNSRFLSFQVRILTNRERRNLYVQVLMEHSISAIDTAATASFITWSYLPNIVNRACASASAVWESEAHHHLMHRMNLNWGKSAVMIIWLVSWLQVTSPEQDGSFCVQDILASVLYSGRK